VQVLFVHLLTCIQTGSEYIWIMRIVDQDVLDRLFEHTRMLKKRRIKDAVKELLASDPETKPPWDREVLRKLLKEAIENGCRKEVSVLFGHGPGLSIDTTFDDEDEDGGKRQSALHLAARYGHAALVEWFLLVQKANLEIKDMDGWTALHISAQNGHYSIVQLLLAAGADIHATTNKEETALYLAVKKNHRKVEELLWKEMDRVDFRANPEAAEKAFVWMARLEKPGQEERLKRLYKTGKAQTPEDKSEKRHTWTALHWAVYYGHLEVVWWLLARGGHMKAKEMKDAKDICNKKILAANADRKRGKSSPEGANTQDATLKMESEGKAYLLVSHLLQNPTFVLGPSAFYDNEEKPPLETLTDEKRTVCDEFATTIVDFYRREGRVDFLYRPCKSYDVIYGSGPEKIMSDAKRSDIRHLEVLRTVASVGRKEDPSKTAAPAPGRPNVRRATGLPSEKQEPKNPEPLSSGKSKAQTSKSMEREEPETSADLGEFQFRWFHVAANNVS